MTASLPALLATGFVLGWSVAWPPGPINAEIVRRCAAGDFWAGIAVRVAASSADAYGRLQSRSGSAFCSPRRSRAQGLGVVSIALLLALAYLFLRGAWRAFARGALPPGRRRRFRGLAHLASSTAQRVASATTAADRVTTGPLLMRIVRC